MNNDQKAYKIRKSGNSDVTTIPREVKDKLGVETGGSISYVFLPDGSIKIEKVEEKIDIDSIGDSVMNQYKGAIEDLFEL
ncbi:AbrB/MazE/SpoVT family DNA-binding domain-containing protein [Enterococcus sp. RIT-PI-f]|uniref:AbrB/MazE/SpoVT family DNA-binding domain-containing protein n=1 Tax=Enterococcus sp. RIT-PI-f TaxID=1690244 RepID=UPI0006B92BFA|nr:AbrB/MazE/SpoVT family DNA-binding domain-containing protein [Enterococcus sp. RIT-PI-f]KPG70440.1 addiction module antitoxin [Enterococcus sp. RIT-PI-f]